MVLVGPVRGWRDPIFPDELDEIWIIAAGPKRRQVVVVVEFVNVVEPGVCGLAKRIHGGIGRTGADGSSCTWSMQRAGKIVGVTGVLGDQF